LAGLHAGLQLTSEQAPLWAPVEAAIRDLAKIHGEMHRRPDDDQPTDGLEQLKRLSARMIRGGQAMKALSDATGPLLATLSDDQRERLPKLLEGIQPRKVLAKAFNLPDRRDSDVGSRDAEDGQSEHRRHRDDADDYRGQRHSYDDEGPHRDRGRHFDGDDDGSDRGRGWHGDQDRGEDRERDGGRHRDRSDDHHDLGQEHRGSEGFRHRPGSDDERT
jgi:hypothetical protein